MPAWLSGGFVDRTTGGDLDSGGTSIDQLLAQRVGEGTPLPSLELGIDAPRSGIDTAGGGFPRALGSFLSWADPNTPVPKEIVPQLAFDRLFRNNRAPVVSSVNPQDPALLASLQRDETSLLDVVLEQAKDLRSKSSGADQARLDEYYESVRAVERRIEASMKPQKRWINEGKFPLDRPTADCRQSSRSRTLDARHSGVGVLDGLHARGHVHDGRRAELAGLLVPRSVPKGSFHGMSHHRDLPEKRAHYERIVTWHVEQFAYLLNKMRNLIEGHGSLLDNSMVLYGGSLSDGNRHTEENLPLLLAGRGKGALRPGRRLRAAPLTPMCNLHLALLHKMGVEDKAFGDSTGVLKAWRRHRSISRRRAISCETVAR